MDLLTVVFRDEISLLKTQARSIDEYVSPEDVNEIKVIVNDVADVAELIDVAWWGKHQSKVKVALRNFNCVVNGWESQQLCKLLGTASSDETWVTVLDAKTWFIQPYDMSKLFDAQGRVRYRSVPLSEHFLSSKNFVKQLYGVDLVTVIGPGGVPFLFHVATVKELVNCIDNFVDFFQVNVKYPNLIAEFYLYSGYVLSKYNTYDVLYNQDDPYYVNFNVAHNEPEKIDVFKQHLSPQLLTASIHRNAYPLLSENQLKTWHDFLIERKLLNS
jgi:hypothetical protein